METLDFKKTFKQYYSPRPAKPEIVDLPKMQFAMVDGAGDPETSPQFQNAIGALYGMVYGLKFGRQKQGRPGFTVGPLEGLWWMPGVAGFDPAKKDKWHWTLMVWLPDFITGDEFTAMVATLRSKKDNPALAKLRLETFREGKSVQVMHIGSYDAEAPRIEAMQAYAKEQGYTVGGKHHEIYLGDPRRAKPEKLRTILRQPIH